MVFRKFQIVCTIRVLLISIFVFLFFYVYFNTQLYASLIIISILIIIQVIALINYVISTNTELSRFLNAIKYSDASQRFVKKGLGKSFEQLNHAFTDIMDELQNARSEKEVQYHYLQTVVHHIGTGVIECRLYSLKMKRSSGMLFTHVLIVHPILTE